MLQQKALGRGLASLIPSSLESSNIPNSILSSRSDFNKYFECAVDKIVPNRDQPRKLFNKETLEELSQSIQEKGVLQPLIVRRLENGQFELVAGERRFRASKLVGLSTVPVVVIDREVSESLELALIENIQRQDLNPIEEALAFKQLMDRYHYTQEICAKKVGKERSSVANSIRLLGLPEEIRGMIIESKLSMGHARSLLAIEDIEVQLRIARKISEQGMSVREVEEWVRKLKEGIKLEEGVVIKRKDPQFNFIETEVAKVFGTKVKIKTQGKKGKIIVDYYNVEDLDRIFNLILGLNKNI
ncbi:MAG: ParB/RepB/Spo0J family partition protein [Deltaproteobacteria bacterium]|nr:ParB/RepB/Spo0J family partition protein [Deltaproteobacteria bacterium]